MPAAVLIGSPDWRREAEREQEQALADGQALVSCAAPLGAGGLGRHLEEILDAFARTGAPALAITAEGDLPFGTTARLLRPLGRLTPAWRVRRDSVAFDEHAARSLPACEQLVGFNGTSLAQLRVARAAGARTLALVSATAHIERVLERHRAARAQHPIERSWASLVARRNLREYALADRIHHATDYVRDSFLERGVAPERLVRFPLTPAARFAPLARAQPERFEVVYVGGFTVDKGVPLLIDAFRRLAHADARLRLVGGWRTPGMRRFVSGAIAADQRIEIAPGDPLESLRTASVCVHAAWCDGFGYAPAEAMACGVPVIVSEDTGMKELVRRGVDGLVLPTGSPTALAEALDAVYRGEELAPASSQRTS